MHEPPENSLFGLIMILIASASVAINISNADNNNTLSINEKKSFYIRLIKNLARFIMK